MNRHRKLLDDNNINGIGYMESVISMDPLQLHNEICATAKSLRQKHSITDLSINPWFYHMPPKPRRVDKIHGIKNLWKLYAASGEDTDSDESDDQFAAESSNLELKTVDEQKKFISPKNNASSAKSETPIRVLKRKEAIGVESLYDSQEKLKNERSKNRKSHCIKVQPHKKCLPVNYAKQREEKLYSLYGSEAYHIKGMENWLDVIQMNYINKFNPPYWPCIPLNHRYADEQSKVQN